MAAEGASAAAYGQAAQVQSGPAGAQSVLLLTVPSPMGNWHTIPCAAIFVLLDADDSNSYRPCLQYSVLQTDRCGNEATNMLVCPHHKQACIYLVARKGDILWQGSTLQELAKQLGCEQVSLQDAVGDLEAKLTLSIQPVPAAAVAQKSATTMAQPTLSAAVPAEAKVTVIAQPSGTAAAAAATAASLQFQQPTVGQQQIVAALAANSAVANPQAEAHIGVSNSTGILDTAGSIASTQAGLNSAADTAADAAAQPGISWQAAPGRSELRLLLPSKPPAGCWQMKPCAGLDLVVGLHQGQAHTLGAHLPLMSVKRCGNEAGQRAACKQHRAGLFQLHYQGSQDAFQQCKTLGELAIWLGYGKVLVLDTDTKQPVQSYQGLVAPPLQLCIPAVGGQQTARLLPPALQASAPYSAHAATNLTIGASKGAASYVNAAYNAAAPVSAAIGNLASTSKIPAAVMAIFQSTAASAASIHAAASGAAASARMAAATTPMQTDSAPMCSQQPAATSVLGSASSVTMASSNASSSSRGSGHPAATTSCTGSSAAAGTLPAADDGNSSYEVCARSDYSNTLIVHVEGQPVGSWQRNPCRALDLVVSLPPGQQQLQLGQHYKLLSVQRCANETGSKSRCKPHADAAFNLLAAPQQTAGFAQQQQQQPAPMSAGSSSQPSQGTVQKQRQGALMVVARASSNTQLASLLGVHAVVLVAKQTGVDLEDAAAWSPSDSSGKAAKVQWHLPVLAADGITASAAY